MSQKDSLQLYKPDVVEKDTGAYIYWDKYVVEASGVFYLEDTIKFSPIIAKQRAVNGAKNVAQKNLSSMLKTVSGYKDSIFTNSIFKLLNLKYDSILSKIDNGYIVGYKMSEKPKCDSVKCFVTIQMPIKNPQMKGLDEIFKNYYNLGDKRIDAVLFFKTTEGEVNSLTSPITNEKTGIKHKQSEK